MSQACKLSVSRGYHANACYWPKGVLGYFVWYLGLRFYFREMWFIMHSAVASTYGHTYCVHFITWLFHEVHEYYMKYMIITWLLHDYYIQYTQIVTISTHTCCLHTYVSLHSSIRPWRRHVSVWPVMSPSRWCSVTLQVLSMSPWGSGNLFKSTSPLR